MSEELKELSITAMGRRIRVIRERKEITREELAEKMDISPAFISDVEYGNKGMSIKNLYLLSQLLGVSAEYLLSGKLYSLDNDEESLRVHEEIVSLLKECTPEQIESFRRISQIFADDMKRVAP
jgi:transcriptional regulator with XRE-family HTH domain